MELEGIEMLKECREHPENYYPLIDHQFKKFDVWEDEIVRNIGWGAGLYFEDRPYFAECWKIFTTTAMTVFISSEGIEDSKNVLQLFMLDMIVRGMISPEKDFFHKANKAVKVTDESGNEFYSINFVLYEEDDENCTQYVHWNPKIHSFEELNRFNEENNPTRL